MKATIRDVARLAQVSTATVSRVVNNSSTISPETRKKVLDAMRLLDYTPNSLASSLRSRHTGVIGVVISDNSNPFFADVVRGVESAASSHGYQVILCNTNNDPETEQKHVNILLQRQIDGLIISVARERGRHLDQLRRMTLPVVFVNRRPVDVDGLAVVTDNLGAMKQAIDHLIALGHRRIALIHGNLDYSTGIGRLEGFKQAMGLHGIQVDPDIIRPGNFNADEAERSTLEILSLKHMPTAIVASDAHSTVGILRALLAAKLRIPEDISVIGFDDHEWASLITPPLTVVAQPSYQLGVESGNKLIAQIECGAKPEGYEEIQLPSRLIIRQSVKDLRR